MQRNSKRSMDEHSLALVSAWYTLLAKAAGQSRAFGREESPGFTGQRAG